MTSSSITPSDSSHGERKKKLHFCTFQYNPAQGEGPVVAGKTHICLEPFMASGPVSQKPQWHFCALILVIGVFSFVRFSPSILSTKVFLLIVGSRLLLLVLSDVHHLSRGARTLRLPQTRVPRRDLYIYIYMELLLQELSADRAKGD